jgi:hypothetical protein
MRRESFVASNPLPATDRESLPLIDHALPQFEFEFIHENSRDSQAVFLVCWRAEAISSDNAGRSNHFAPTAAC